MRQHRSLPVVRWIQQLRRSGVEYEVATIEVGINSADAERFYISYFRWLGFDVLNVTDGGEGKPSSGLDTQTLRRLREFIQIMDCDENRIATALGGISKTAIRRAAAGLGVRSGTAFTIKTRLDVLGA